MLQGGVQSFIGRRLGHYRLLRRIGAGGMGHVYAATDERSSQLVAVKVLPEGLFADEQQRRRFRREIHALSQIHHPNIAAIYDFDTQGDSVFFAMEYVEGETLASRLGREHIPMQTAYSIATQVAEAIAAAHARGILHRDLKPGNVMLQPSGGVKVVDFGIAKSLDVDELPARPGTNRTPSPASKRATRAPNMTRLTRSDQVVGTPGYMSPEQISGLDADPRTDIFSFGCVLFECLTGRPAFPGSTSYERVAATIARNPDWESLGPSTPTDVRELLEACLAKDPSGRLGSFEEVKRPILAARAGASPAGPSAVAPGSRGNLPAGGTPFVGRRRDIDHCRKRLTHSRLVTITGAGGTGKTRLALRVAELSLHDFPGGVWFVDLVSAGGADRVEGILAATLGLAEASSGRRWRGLSERLDERPALILLDNCEEFPDAAARLVGEVLDECPQVRFLATSRVPLHSPHETLAPLGPLSLPRAEGLQSLESIAPFDSVALFVARAEAADNEFRLTEENAALVASLCRRLEGIPLALELAASRLGQLSMEDLAARLKERFELSRAAEQAGDPRHATLQSVVRWSYDHSTASEQRALKALSIFAAGAPVRAVAFLVDAESDSPELRQALATLAGRSLLDVRRSFDGGARYVVSEIIRAFVREEAVGPGEMDRLHSRHLTYYRQLVDGADSGLRGEQQTAWLSRLDEEHDDILAALRWSFAGEGRGAESIGIVNAIWRFWFLRAYVITGASMLERVLATNEGARRTADRAKALRSLAILIEVTSAYAESRPRFAESLDISREIGDEQGIAFSQSGLAGIAMNLGDYETAIELYREGAAFLERRGDQTSLGMALGNLALAARYQKRFDEAERYFVRSMRASRAGGDHAGAVMNLTLLASTRLSLGKLDSGLRTLMQAIGLASKLGVRRALAMGIKWAGDLALGRGDLEAAARHYGGANSIRTTIGVPMWTDDPHEMEMIARTQKELGGPRYLALEAEGARLSDAGAAEMARAWLRTTARSAPARAPARPAQPTSRESTTKGSHTTAQILRMARKGDRQARDLLCRRFMPVLRRWAHGRLPGGARGFVDTDDLVQVTMVRAVGRVHLFDVRGEGAFLAYLRRILLNKIRDEARRAKRRPIHEALTESLAAATPSPLDRLVAFRSHEAYERALETLPKRTREAIVLRLEMGYGFARIAAALGIPTADAARMLFKRGLATLAKRLESAATARLSSSRVL